MDRGSLMSLAELIPTLRELSRADKLRAMQFLLQELARGEDAVLAPDASFPVWSPYAAGDAAETLLSMLADEGTARGRS
jgi:hypothetical protein